MAITLDSLLAATAAGNQHDAPSTAPDEALARFRSTMQARAAAEAAARTAAEQQKYDRQQEAEKRSEAVRQFGLTHALNQAKASTELANSERAQRELETKNLEGVHSLDPTEQQAAQERFLAAGGQVVEQPEISGTTELGEPDIVAGDMTEMTPEQAALESSDILGDNPDISGILENPEVAQAMTDPGVAQAAKTLLKSRSGMLIASLDPKMDQKVFDQRKDSFEKNLEDQFGKDIVGKRINAMLGSTFVTFRGDTVKALEHLAEMRKTMHSELDRDLDRSSREEIAALRAAAEASGELKPLSLFNQAMIGRYTRKDTEQRLHESGYSKNVEVGMELEKILDKLNAPDSKSHEDAAKLIHKIADPGVLLEGEKANMFGPMGLAERARFLYSLRVDGKYPPEIIQQMKNMVPYMNIGIQRKYNDLYHKELTQEFEFPIQSKEHWRAVRARFPALAGKYKTREEALRAQGIQKENPEAAAPKHEKLDALDARLGLSPISPSSYNEEEEIEIDE